MKRLFIAIALPDNAKAALAAVRTDLAGTIPGAKWVGIEGAHLTLKFLGPVDDHAVNDISVIMTEVVHGRQAFVYSIKGLGAFPNTLRPRVIWAGINDQGQTAALSNGVERAMEWLGYPPEDRPFSPHITLARIKNPSRLSRQGLIEERGRMLDLPNLEAVSITLFESRLSPRGASYTELFQATLEQLKKEH